METEATREFRSRMSAAPGIGAVANPGSRTTEYRDTVAALASLLEKEGTPWRGLPRVILQTFRGRGWAWNGIYVLDGDRLELAAAAGPPVCHTLERVGGIGSSGMCFDAVLLNQTVVTQNVHEYPGYVSCDGESGLSTQAGLVCPIRGVDGDPVAIWDLDCTQALEPEDPPFFDRLFQVLSSLLKPAQADFR